MNLLDRIAYDTGGFTVQEILSSFCKKILEIIDLVNKNEEVCDESRTIIENIRNEVVPDLVDDIMKEMQDSGYFDNLVNVTLIEQLRTEITRLLNQAITDYTTRLDNIDSQLDKIKNNIMPNYLSELLIEEITQPNSDFSWFKHKIYRNKNGEIYTDLKIEEYKNKGGTTYYVDIINGSERNNGLTIDTPFKYLKTAIDKTDVGTIYVKDGFYDYGASFNNTTYSKNINIIGIGENVVCCYGTNSLSWEKADNYNNIYKVERSVLGGIFDKTILTETGDYTKYSLVSSLSDVENNEGTYYYEHNIIYIHPFNSRTPDNNIIVMLQGGNLKVTGDYKVYLENIKFYGGANGCVNINNTVLSDNTLLVAKNCEFKYSTGGVGGLQIQGADAILLNCIASSNLKDGFNYHAYNNRINKVVEINCIGRDNGESLEVSYSDNGSTIHDGGKIIRINGKYFNNLGPNIADVGLGSMVWNLGCASYKSNCEPNTHNCDYWCGDSTKTVKMWLDTCISFNSLRSCYVGENSELYYKNNFMEGEIVRNNNSVFEEY